MPRPPLDLLAGRSERDRVEAEGLDESELLEEALESDLLGLEEDGGGLEDWPEDEGRVALGAEDRGGLEDWPEDEGVLTLWEEEPELPPLDRNVSRSLTAALGRFDSVNPLLDCLLALSGFPRHCPLLSPSP